MSLVHHIDRKLGAAEETIEILRAMRELAVQLEGEPQPDELADLDRAEAERIAFKARRTPVTLAELAARRARG